MYYDDKRQSLADIFGVQDVELRPGVLTVDKRTYPIVNDVIILGNSDEYTPFVRHELGLSGDVRLPDAPFSEAVQYSFGQEWKSYGRVLPDHRQTFQQYFDLIDLETLEGLRVCDLGCGSGRWSYFLTEVCREIVLVDFSDAIFVARKNLQYATNGLFFMGDITRLPFREGFADFCFSLGVLMHLPTPCLDEIRRISRWSPRNLVYVYYALDNRPWFFRLLLRVVTVLRRRLAQIRSPRTRIAIAKAMAWFVYVPVIQLGRLASKFGLGRLVPLHDAYADKSIGVIEHNAYDRFFTPIEQRVTRKDIMTLADTYSKVMISESLPYWHFLCEV